MPIQGGLFRTRVARRILVLFVLVALVPVVVMGAVSFVAVRRQLNAGADDALRGLASAAGQSLAQQLLVTQGGLEQVKRALAAEGNAASSAGTVLPPSVEALAIHSKRGGTRVVTGDPGVLPSPDSAGRALLASGRMLVVSPRGSSELFAAVAMDSTDVDGRVLWARLRPDSIWEPADQFTALTTRADFCVLGGSDEVMFCHSGDPAVGDAFRSAIRTRRSNDRHAGTFRARIRGKEVITAYRRILMTRYGVSAWTILVSESAQSVLRPLTTFSYSFPLALLLGLSVVGLFANILVRRTMEPLAALEDGTRRISAGDLSARVPVTSVDEFGTVAASFNRMAGHLALTFHQIETGRAIDQAVLTARSSDDAVTAVLSHFGALVPSREVTVLLMQDGDGGAGRLRSRTADGDERAAAVTVGPEQAAWLRSEPDHRVVVGSSEILDALAGAPHEDRNSARVIFPLLARERALGAVWYQPPSGATPSDEDVARARQIADQATVALDELRLMAELEELNWGALRALARAIDAKSRWTSGHSERVTELAVEIARDLGFDAAALQHLHRGGLLHDIGKIGVPAAILDRRGVLSPEDRAIMNEHPLIGVRILEPIQAFSPILPIVRSHHERWDGHGYPDALAGEDIDPLARILAVADVYDAMVSDRPYRDRLVPESVLDHMRDERGHHFEPRAVDAFLRVMARRGLVVPTHE